MDEGVNPLLEQVLHLLPQEISAKIELLPVKAKQQLEEIRIRENRPLEIIIGQDHFFMNRNGELQQFIDYAYKPTSALCRRFLERITNYSLYSMEEQLKRGFITVTGGHRIGLAGRTILENGEVKGLRDITGFNIRIAREIKGTALPLMRKIINMHEQHVDSTLIIAPPQFGKTTLIRDIARCMSYGLYQPESDYAVYEPLPIRSKKVAIVDERSEIAACYKGVPTFDVGPRTDVMDACPKAEGMMMMIRSMSPEVIVVDEIGRAEDVRAIQEASHAGIKVIASIHGYHLEDVYKRQDLHALFGDGTFRYVIELKRDSEGFMHRVINVKQWLQQKQSVVHQ